MLGSEVLCHMQAELQGELCCGLSKSGRVDYREDYNTVFFTDGSMIVCGLSTEVFFDAAA